MFPEVSLVLGDCTLRCSNGNSPHQISDAVQHTLVVFILDSQILFSVFLCSFRAQISTDKLLESVTKQHHGFCP